MVVEDGVTVTVGVWFTVTTTVWVSVQLLFEPVTVYVVVPDGEAITEEPVVLLSPVGGDHVYELAPLAVNVTFCPVQMDGAAGLTVTDGDGITVTVAVALPVPQLPDPVTV